MAAVSSAPDVVPSASSSSKGTADPAFRITFVTGNANKLKEVTRILNSGDSPFPAEVVNKDIDMPELQGTPEEVALEKCRMAAERAGVPVITEDVSLCFDALGGLPGPYIKWFLKGVGLEGLHKLLAGFEDKGATAQCNFAFCAGPGAEPKLYQGKTRGKIVAPRGPRDFGWDAVFEPDEGGGKTYAELEKTAKDAISHRGRALAMIRADFSARAAEIQAEIAAAAAAAEGAEGGGGADSGTADAVGEKRARTET